MEIVVHIFYIYLIYPIFKNPFNPCCQLWRKKRVVLNGITLLWICLFVIYLMGVLNVKVDSNLCGKWISYSEDVSVCTSTVQCIYRAFDYFCCIRFCSCWPGIILRIFFLQKRCLFQCCMYRCVPYLCTYIARIFQIMVAILFDL